MEHERFFNSTNNFTRLYTSTTRRNIFFWSFSFQFVVFRSYTRTFLYLILHSPYDVRKFAFDIIRRLVNNLRSSETDISLAILDNLQIQTNTELNLSEENSSTTVSKAFEETILCLAKSMRMQEENAKISLCHRALLVASTGRVVLHCDEKLWWKFLFYIFEKKSTEIDSFISKHVESLVKICSDQRRFRKVNIWSIFQLERDDTVRMNSIEKTKWSRQWGSRMFDYWLDCRINKSAYSRMTKEEVVDRR